MSKFIEFEEFKKRIAGKTIKTIERTSHRTQVRMTFEDGESIFFTADSPKVSSVELWLTANNSDECLLE